MNAIAPRSAYFFVTSKLFVRTRFSKTAGVYLAINGFRKAKIFPVNKDVFDDCEFNPAQVTD